MNSPATVRVTRDGERRRVQAPAAVIDTVPATPGLKHVVLITPGLFQEPGAEARYRELALALVAKTAALSIVQVRTDTTAVEPVTENTSRDAAVNGGGGTTAAQPRVRDDGEPPRII